MADFVDVRVAFEELISSELSGIAVEYENVEIGKNVEEYVSVYLAEEDSGEFSMGGKSTTVDAIAIFAIRTKFGTGADKARTVARSILSILTNANIVDVSLKGPFSFQSVGRVPETSLYQHNLAVKIEYHYGN